MKKFRAVSAALALVGSVALTNPANAQTVFRQLGWISSMTASCATIACTTVTFTLNLGGLQSTDNTGDAVPANILALGSPGYVNTLNLFRSSGTWNFLSGTITSGGSWSTQVTGGGIILQNTASAPFPGAPIVLVATFDASGNKDFFYSGFAYLDANGGTATGSCNAGTCTYVNGDFNGNVSAVPEPMTMGLMATGLVGLALVGHRRRKQQQHD